VAGENDRFVEVVPGGDKLLVVRGGVVYALEAATGRQLWRFPEKGQATHDMGMGRTTAFMHGVLGDCLITSLADLEGNRGGGLLAINLADGKVKRQFVFGTDAPKFTVGKYVSPGWYQPAGKRMAFSCQDEEGKRYQIAVIDLETWTEVSRFDAPLLDYTHDLRVVGDMVAGVIRMEGVGAGQIFTADLKAGQLYVLPLRQGYLHGLVHHVLADGSQLIPEGRVNARCGYERPWPKAGLSRLIGGNLYVRDERGFYRADSADGHELWRLTLPYRGSLGGFYRGELLTRGASSEVVTLTEGGLIYVVEAAGGKPRAVIRALPASALSKSFHASETITAWDSERVYFSCLEGLRVYSTRPVDPAKPDPTDSGDPTSYLANCRAALVRNDHQAALDGIQGIGVAIGLRPAQRREAAELLSQLARSPVAELNPRAWQEVLLTDGPLAGELFMAEYERLAEKNPAAVAALMAIGTDRALVAASRLVPGEYSRGDTLPLALEAARKRGGARPVEQALAIPGLRPWRVLDILTAEPMDEATFARWLPRMRECVPKEQQKRDEVSMAWGRGLLLFPPARVQAVLEGMTRQDAADCREVCRKQAESQAKGEGEKQPLNQVKAKPPVEEF